MYLRSSFEHSSRPTFPPQPLLEFRFGSHHHIASPLSTPLPIPSHFRTAPCHSRTKSFSPYLASSKSLAPLYQKTPGVRTLASISARSKLRTAPGPVILSGVTRPFSSAPPLGAAGERSRMDLSSISTLSPTQSALSPRPQWIMATLQQHYKPSVPSRPCPQGPLPPSSLPLLVHSSCAKLFQGNRLT